MLPNVISFGWPLFMCMFFELTISTLGESIMPERVAVQFSGQCLFFRLQRRKGASAPLL
jgi:hypothetical protein